MLPKFPIKIGFDIENNPEFKDVWAYPEARTLFLLWRPGHIVNQYFLKEVLEIGYLINEKKPKTSDDLARCLNNYIGSNFTTNDSIKFSQEALPYFTGEKQIEYQIEMEKT